MDKNEMHDTLVVALGLALEEIHHPGMARNAGIDITALCEGIIKEATRTHGVPQMIRDEVKRRAAL
jgi:hypothetical protein